MVLKANTDAFVVEPEKLERDWSGPAFWIRWVGATALGWSLHAATNGAVLSLMRDFESPVAHGVAAVSWVVVLLCQWLVLRPWVDRAWRWIPVSFAGHSLGLAAALAAKMSLRAAVGERSIILESVSGLLIVNVCAALAQWLLLRTLSRQAWRWLIATAFWVALHAPVTVAGALLASSRQVSDEPVSSLGAYAAVALLIAAAGSALVGAIGGAFVGAITGAEMAWLLRHPKSAPSPE